MKSKNQLTTTTGTEALVTDRIQYQVPHDYRVEVSSVKKDTQFEANRPLCETHEFFKAFKMILSIQHFLNGSDFQRVTAEERLSENYQKTKDYSIGKKPAVLWTGKNLRFYYKEIVIPSQRVLIKINPLKGNLANDGEIKSILSSIQFSGTDYP